MSARPPLDLSRLAVSTIPLQAILFLSAAVGVVLGIALIITVSFATALAVPLGFVAMIGTVLTASVAATQLTIIGAAAVFLIPLGALVSAHWKLRHAELFILDDLAAERADPNSKIGQYIAVMSKAAGLDEVPRYGIIENVFNALAMSGGRGVGLVMLGQPLVDALHVGDTLAILGHEIGHVAMLDSKRKFLAEGHQQFLVRFLRIVGLHRLGRALFGFIGEVALAAHSREREFWADAVGAHITSPAAMISALRAIERSQAKPTEFEKSYATLMFRPVPRLFATHPPFAKRIEALERRTYLDRLPLKAIAAEPQPEAVLSGQQSYAGI